MSEHAGGEYAPRGVPRSQQRDMLTHLKGEEQKAVKRLNKSVGYAERRRAEDDLAGIQHLRARVMSWDVEDD